MLIENIQNLGLFNLVYQVSQTPIIYCCFYNSLLRLPALYRRKPGQPGNFLLHWRKDAPQPTAIIRDALLLLRSGDHADLTIRSKEGKEFKAHRLILVARDEKLFGGENGEFEWMSHLSSQTIEGLLTILYGGMDRKKKERKDPELIRFVLPIYIEVMRDLHFCSLTS